MAVKGISDRFFARCLENIKQFLFLENTECPEVMGVKATSTKIETKMSY